MVTWGCSILSNEESKRQCFTCFLLLPDPIFSFDLYLPCSRVYESCHLHSWVGLCLPKCCAGQKRAKECQLHGKRQVHRGLLLLALLRTRVHAFDSPKERQFCTPRVQHPKSRGIHLSWKTLGKFCCGNFESLLIMHTQFKWYVLPSALLPQQVCLQVASFCTLSRAGNLISFISCSFVHIYG